MDIGRLFYAVQVAEGDFPACPQHTLAEKDANLTRASVPAPQRDDSGGLTDLAADQPASPANTFTFTVNLTQCLASRGLSFNPGETRTLSFGGNTSGGQASQNVSFKRQ